MMLLLWFYCLQGRLGSSGAIGVVVTVRCESKVGWIIIYICGLGYGQGRAL